MIEKMNKICIAGLKDEKSEVLKSISKFGVLHISSEPEDSFEYDGDKLQDIEKKLTHTKNALKILKTYDTEKKPLFQNKIVIEETDFFSMSDKTYGDVSEIMRNKEELEFLKTQLPKFENEKLRLMPYSSWEIGTNKIGTDKTLFIIGFFDKTFNEALFSEEASDLYVTPYFLSQNSDGFYYGFVVLKSSYDDFLNILKKHGFVRMSDLNVNSNISEILKILDVRINNTKRKIEHYEEALKKFVKCTEDIKKYHDALETRLEIAKADISTLSTKYSYIINGYIPKTVSEKIKEKIQKRFSAVVVISDVPDDEEFPVLMSNPAAIAPFEVVTEMYSMPSSKGIDPSAVMAPFYFVFFGMMLSDAGYGILLSLATGFVLKKMKPSGQFKKLCSLLFVCGISTFIFGMIFGSFFSDLISTLTLGKVVQPALINPMNDPMTVLIIGYILGAVHIMTGLGVKAYMLIKSKQIWSAIFDIGSWYLVFIGIGLFLIPLTSAYGIYVIIAGAVLLVLTQGRHEKNIIKKITSGILSLYDATGYLSDILSYSRLLALGLSTAVVGMVVNKMGALGATNGWSISSALIFTLVFLIGHGFNIVINVLGSYVHTCRLMYIEFFSKFYESGGKPFKPLSIKNKYTKID